MPFGIAIRAARASEAEALSALAFRSKAYWGYPDDFMQACREELTYTPEQLAASPIYFAVAEHRGTIAGFYALAAMDDDAVELEALFVEPEWIGAGIGRGLLAHARERARQLGRSRMVVQSDPHAEAFYVQAGGVAVGTRESASIPGRRLKLFAMALE